MQIQGRAGRAGQQQGFLNITTCLQPEAVFKGNASGLDCEAVQLGVAPLPGAGQQAAAEHHRRDVCVPLKQVTAPEIVQAYARPCHTASASGFTCSGSSEKV